MSALLDVTLPIFLVIGFGYASVWRGYLEHDGAESIMKFTQNFAIPCLLFLAISRLDLGQNFDLPLLFSYYFGSIAIFVFASVGTIYLFGRPVEDAIVIGFAAMFSNSVLLGLPVTERAFGAEALGPNYVIVALHAPICYLFGITAMEIARNKGGGLFVGVGAVARSMLRNALMIAIALGFAVNLIDWTPPEPVTGALELMASASLPAALFALGGVLVRYRPEGDMVQIAFVGVAGLILHPALTLGMAKLTGIGTPAMQSAVLTASMAPGVNAYIFANMYGRAKRVAASAVLIGTAVSILTVSAWLAIIG